MATKYNLRCNRSISEKMMKKDFIYDIRRPIPTPIVEKPIVSLERILDFECNYCHEPIATLHSLSTHVKCHCANYCKVCFWILKPNETMEEHMKQFHFSESTIF
ncbi:uncharacterized protein LOC117177141 [Belonocnema kinseyi]|uniref:uncharacterized protein LOC117177141 n=1 Tax=Belonocnema kinseyi TaxID=2817044 RepID=UPI00143D4C1E|nr:uncharacterized protein LOC117177141 [Belonocnema kinseyi]